MAKLSELLTEDEISQIKKQSWLNVDVDTDFADLTIRQISDIASIVIATKNFGRVRNCVLGAEAIKILTLRSITLNVPLF